MKFLNLEQIEAAVHGKIISNVHKNFQGVGTDTRKPMKDEVFIALRGHQFDAHDFVEKAIEQGATALIVDKELENLEDLKNKVSIIQVKDTLEALQGLAHFWRHQHPFKVVAITGSNGKTTSKQFTAEILASQFKVSYSEGSFNNHWGVPISILNAPKEAEIIVLEMGMNHKGEIQKLCQIADPDVVVVTTVGYSHVGEVGTITDIKEAKEEIYSTCPESVAIFNLANEYTSHMFVDAMKNHKHKSVLTFSNFSEEAPDVGLRVTHLTLDSLTIQGQISGVEGTCQVNVFGRHNINNIMVAASIALACGMTAQDIWKALPNCKTIWGRNQLLKLKSGAMVIFDGYNANLESMTALIKNLYELDAGSGQKIAILGEMFELGGYAESFHYELGQFVGRSLIDFVWFLGPHAETFKLGLEAGGFQKNFEISEGYELSLASKVRHMLKEGDIVVIKGSRGMKLEQVLLALEPIDFKPQY